MFTVLNTFAVSIYRSQRIFVLQIKHTINLVNIIYHIKSIYKCDN